MSRVAVVHDWLTGMRGGEAVLEAILDALPSAELFTLFHFPGSVSAKIESRTIHTSELQPLARRARDYRTLLPLFPRAVRRWDFREFDLIVSSSHCVAKGIDARGKPHLSYCHTPMRYIWDRFDDYFPRKNMLRRAAAQSIAPWLRRWDVATAKEVTHFVANSRFVRDRIRRYYDRDAELVHPYVDDEFLETPLREGRDDYHMMVSALVPYKKVELAVAAAVASGRKLVVAGGGPLLGELRARSGSGVTFMGPASRASIIERLARAKSLILPGVEDFGITPLEAMALGTPVVALGEGGVLDSVVDGVTGIFFPRPDVESLRGALDAVEARVWDRAAIRAHASAFSRAQFDARFAAALERVRG
ncbi:MAG: glycosyltransferase [Acidobacteria bacterium]|nr:glycosyltransferase [Acidobacteriota bacterium]MBV9476660.1 glycosyltransferase [Acidobacteriota bacterium]